MPSKSLRDLEDVKCALNELAALAQQSDEHIIKTLQAQAVHIHNLTALCVTMHKKLFPEQYDANGLPLGMPDKKEPDAPVHQSLIITP